MLSVLGLLITSVAVSLSSHSKSAGAPGTLLRLPPIQAHRPAWAAAAADTDAASVKESRSSGVLSLNNAEPIKQLRLKRGANVSEYALEGSRSQFGEELNAWNRYLYGHRNGTFLELGGLDGLLYSNSYVLEHTFGWRGVIIEGSPSNFEQVVRNRPGVLAIHSAVCNTSKMVAFLERRTKGCCRGVVESLSENGLTPPPESDPRVIQVPCRPFRDVIEVSPIKHFNIMFLDVEGGELGVLSGIDHSAVTFDVICIEGARSRAAAYEALLAPHGYELVTRRVKARHNTWFLRRGFNASSRDDVYKLQL